MNPQQAAPAAAPAVDPLAQLRDITLPDPVGLWPLAPGWWILLALVLSAVIWLALHWWRQRRANAYRHVAAAALDSAWDDYRQNRQCAEFLQALQTLLRRTALHAYPGTPIAGLHGQRWLRFLDHKLQGSEFSQGQGQALLSAPYQANPELDPTALYQLGRRWLQDHQRPRGAARA